MTILEARGETQRLAGETLNGRVALVARGGRGLGTAIGRSLARRRAWALSGSREM
jgi:hypothetical protein